MAGYGGQMIALDVLTPSENQSQLADTSIKQSQAELDQQALPTRIQTLKSQLEGLDLGNTKSALDLQVQRQKTKNEVQGLQQGLLANAFATFDPDAPDAAARWDEMIDKLVEDGAPQAAQFKGRYSPKMAERWAHAYSAQSPGAALSDVSGAGGGGGAEVQGGQAGIGGAFSGITGGTEATQFDRLFAGKSPQEIQKAAQSVSAHMAAVRRVEQSANPLQALQQEAVNLGYSPLQVAGLQASDVPNLLAKIKATYGPMENYLTARMGRTGSGIPQPEIPAELKDVGGNLYGIDTSHPANPKANILAEGAGKFQPYSDAEGNTWSFDAKTGQFEKQEGGPKGLMRPTGTGRGGAGSVYEQKRTAWLEVHPGDIRGALDYAAGRSAKLMTPAEIQKSAISQAQRDYTAISLTGPPTDPATGKPVDPQTWMNNRAREIAGELTTANAQPATPPAPAAGPGGAQGAPSSLTAPQRAAAQRYKGAKAAVGTQGNPFTPTSEHQYKALPSGAYYLVH
jgi:hypothetical protein